MSYKKFRCIFCNITCKSAFADCMNINCNGEKWADVMKEIDAEDDKYTKTPNVLSAWQVRLLKESERKQRKKILKDLFPDKLIKNKNILTFNEIERNIIKMKLR